MKFDDLLYRLITSSAICEQAFKRKEVEDKIIELSHTIGVHVIELIIYTDIALCRSKWINEIKTKLEYIYGLKIKNGIRVNYYDSLYDKYWNHEEDNELIEGTIYGIIQKNKDIENHRIKEITLDEIKNKLKETMILISDLIPNYHHNDQEIDKILRSL